jgi:hypothetical protein
VRFWTRATRRPFVHCYLSASHGALTSPQHPTPEGPPIKYVLVYSTRPDLVATVPPEQLGQAYGALVGWFDEHDAAFVGSGAQLEDADTAKTVRNAPDDERAAPDLVAFRRNTLPAVAAEFRRWWWRR